MVPFGTTLTLLYFKQHLSIIKNNLEVLFLPLKHFENVHFFRYVNCKIFVQKLSDLV